MDIDFGRISPADIVRGRAAITDGASTSIIAAPGASYRLVITDVVISNSSATAAEVDIRDGTGGSVLETFPAPVDGGVVYALRTPIVLTNNTAAAADPDAALTSIKVGLRGFRAPAA